MPANTSVWREGIIAGVLGAAGVAVWFLGVDLIAGSPLRTPAALGGIMLSVFGGADQGRFINAVAYTVFHVAAFLAVGLAASKLVEMSQRMPHLTVGLLLFFVVFELGFYFVAMAMHQFDIMGTLGWYQVGAANLVAAALMGGYLWQRHPELKARITMALDGRI